MTDARWLMAWQRALTQVALIAAVFSLLLGGLLIAHAVRIHAYNPFTAPALKAMKAQITQGKQTERTPAYQQLDANYQAQYFAGRRAVERGLPLLAGGIAVCLLAGLIGALLRRNATDPRDVTTPQPTRTALAGRYAIAVCGLLLAGTLVGLAAIPPPQVPPIADGAVATALTPETPGTLSPPDGPGPSEPSPTPPDAPINLTEPANPPLPAGAIKPASPANPVPATSAIDIFARLPKAQAQNWPSFRGPAGIGLAKTTTAPLQWDVKSGKGVLWKADVPLPGHNAPIVWGDSVFLAGADGKKEEVYCFDADNGKLRWRGGMTGITGSPEDFTIDGDTGFAAPTMATDGECACALFPTGDVAAFDFAGKRLWAKNIGPFESQYGFAASLVMYQGLLILQLDQGTGADEGLSELLALHANTGKTAWRVKARPVANSWSSPIIIPTAKRDELITCGKPWVIAYNPADGKELWRADVLEGDIAASPAYGNGLLLVVKPYQAILALRPGGAGDVTKSAMAWQADGNAPDTTSPAANDAIFVTTSTTTLTCGDMKTGKTLWEYDLGANAYASPVIAGDRIYLPDLEGTMHILAAAKTKKVLGTMKLGDSISATPAFVGNRIYIRTGKYLYCVGGGA